MTDNMQMLGMGGAAIMSAFAGTYVAPPAGEEGGPPGYNPYMPAAEVIIDPDGPATVLRPRELTRQLMEKSLNHRLKPNQQLSERRTAASDAMQELARNQSSQAKAPISEDFVGNFSPIVMDMSKGESSDFTPVIPGQPLVPQANPIVQPQRGPKTEAAPAPVVAVAPPSQPQFAPQPAQFGMQPAHSTVKQSNWGAFVEDPVPLQIPVINEGQPPPRSFPRIPSNQVAALPPRPAEPAIPPPAPPSLRVDFEVDGNPFTSQGWYHKAIRSRHTIVLVFDDRCQGYPRVFPPMIDSPMRMHIHGQSKLFEVQSAGHRFFFEPIPGLKFEMDLLLITQEYDLPAEDLSGG